MFGKQPLRVVLVLITRILNTGLFIWQWFPLPTLTHTLGVNHCRLGFSWPIALFTCTGLHLPPKRLHPDWRVFLLIKPLDIPFYMAWKLRAHHGARFANSWKGLADFCAFPTYRPSTGWFIWHLLLLKTCSSAVSFWCVCYPSYQADFIVSFFIYFHSLSSIWPPDYLYPSEDRLAYHSPNKI